MELANYKQQIPSTPSFFLNLNSFFALFAFLFFIASANAQICSINAGFPETICASDAFVLKANTSAINVDFPTFKWNLINQPQGANVLIESSNALQSNILGEIIPGTYTFEASVKCSDNQMITQQVNYVVVAEPNSMSPYVQNENCYAGGDITLQGIAPNPGEYVQWTYLSGYQGTLNNDKEVNATFIPSLTQYECQNENPFFTIFEYAVYNAEGCVSTRTHQINYYPTEFDLFAESVPEVNCGLCTTLYGSCPMNGTGLWTYQGPGTATFSNPTNAETGVCVDVEGTYQFTWTVTDGCRSGSIDTPVSFQDNGVFGMIDVDAGPSTLFCEFPESTILNGSDLPSEYMGQWLQIKGAPANIVSPNNPNTVVSGLAPGGGPYTFAWSILGTGCGQMDTVNLVEKIPLDWSKGQASGCTASYSYNDLKITESIPFPFQSFEVIEMTITMLEMPEATPFVRIFKRDGIAPPGANSFPSRMIIDEFSTVGLGQTAQFTFQKTEALTYWMEKENVKPDWSYILGLSYTTDAFPPGKYKAQISINDGCRQYAFVSETNNNYHNNQIPNAGTDLVLPCGIENVTLAGNFLTTPQGGINMGKWSMIEGPMASPFNVNNAYDPTAELTNLVEGFYRFRYTLMGGSDCSLFYDEVEIKVGNQIPLEVSASAENNNLCANGSTWLHGSNGDNGFDGQWVQISPATPASIYPNNSESSVLVYDLAPNTNYVFQWEVSNQCGSNSDQVTLTVGNDIAPSPAILINDQICLTVENTTSIEASTISSGTGLWTIISSPINSNPMIENPNIPTTNINGLNEPGTYELKWTVTSGTCALENEATLVIQKNELVNLNAGSDQSLCGISFPTTFSLNGMVNGTSDFQWEMMNGPAPLVFDNNKIENPSITATVAGTYLIALQSQALGCFPVIDYVEVVLNESPSFSFAGIDQNICGGTGAINLEGLVPSVNEQGFWQVVEATGDTRVIFDDYQSATTSALLTEAGTVTLQWTVFNNSMICPPQIDEVVISWTPTADAGNDLSVCNQSSILLEGNGSSLNPGLWTQESGPTTAILNAQGEGNVLVENLVAGIYLFKYEMINEGCTSFDEVQVEIDPQIDAVAGNDIETCNNTVDLVGNIPPIGTTGNWSIVSGDGIAYLNTLSMHEVQLMDVQDNTTYLLSYSINNGTCSSIDYVEVSTVFCCSMPAQLEDVDILNGVDCAATLTDVIVRNLEPNTTYEVNLIIDGIDQIPFELTTSAFGILTIEDISGIQLNSIHLVPTNSTACMLPIESNWIIAIQDCGKIGDLVWFDTNQNGLQESIEQGVNGVEILLYRDSDLDGNPDGEAIQHRTSETINGIKGSYLFDNVPPGDYILKFVVDESCTYTSNVNTNDATEINSDVVNGFGLTAPFVFPEGDEDLSFDAGIIFETLPITLSTFELSTKSCNVFLDWTTETEKDALHFEIQRSDNAIDFTTIGQVDAAGNSTNLRHYEFVDENAEAINYYRLKMVDEDGSYAYSDIEIIKTNCDFMMDVFPNPVGDDWITINFDADNNWPKEGITLQILSIHGVCIDQIQIGTDGKIQSSYKYDMTNLVAGTYIFQYTKGESKETQSIKVVKI